MGRNTDSEKLSAWITLLQAHAAVVDALERKLEREGGIPLAWHEVLSRLAAEPEGRLRMLDLAGLVMLSKSGVTRLIDRMEGAGLVTRGACPTDRRVTYAIITAKGRETLQRATPAFLQGVEEYFSSHLSDSDVDDLRAALRKVLEGNGRWEEHRCSAPSLEMAEPASA
ncbi:MAG TPA: MarR family transcriptional regulator [Actinomycetota bacterium]|jgi:DNA-binding MarR family transcriptional regulator